MNNQSENSSNKPSFKIKIHRSNKEKYGSLFEDEIWIEWTENWFKLLEWITLIAIFLYISESTGNKPAGYISQFSFALLFFFLYNKFFKLCWFRYRFSKLLATISSVLVTSIMYKFTAKIVEEIAGKF